MVPLKDLSIMLCPLRNTSSIGACPGVAKPARRQRDLAVEYATLRGVEDIKCMLQKHIEHAG